MKLTETKLKDCFILEPILFEDERGYFFESFNLDKFRKLTGQDVNFVQDNQSFSKKGALRGLHYQIGEWAQAKLVSVLKGKVLDVVVDLRVESKTYGEHFSIELSADNKKQLFIPRGFAHGFVVLSETAKFFYKCDNYYHKDSERGIVYNDPKLAIDWKIDANKIVLSSKDAVLPKLKNASI